MFKLKNESEHHYEIETPEGQSFHVAKQGLSEKMHGNIRKLADGGEIESPVETGDIAPAETEAEVPSPISEVAAPTGAIKETTAPITPALLNTPTSPAVAQEFKQASEKERAGLRESAEAKADLGKAESGILGEQVTNAQQELSDHKEREDSRMLQQAKIAQEIADTKIDPKHYFGNLNTAGKVSTVIGLILGGLGGGKNGASAIKVLDDQIRQDVDAQKANLENKNSLYAKNLAASGDERAATLLTQSQQLSITQAKLAQAAAKNKTPEAQAAYTTTSALIDKQQSQISQQLFVYNLQNKIAGGGEFDSALAPFAPHPAQVVHQGNGKALYANSPAGHAKVSEALSTFNPAIEALEDLSTGKVNPLDKTSAEYVGATSKIATLPLLLKKAFGVGRLNKEFQELVEKAAADPTKVAELIYNHDPKTEALLKTLKSMKEAAIAPHVSGYKTRSALGFSVKR